MKWEHRKGTPGVMSQIWYAGDYVISDHSMGHSHGRFVLSYRPPGQHHHVGVFESLQAAKSAAEAHRLGKKNPGGILDAIRAGMRVTIVDRFGKRHTGRAVMRGPHGWVLNMGGRHGTPAIADNENIVKVSGRGVGNNPSRYEIVYERGWNVVVAEKNRYIVLRHSTTVAHVDSAYPRNADGLSLAKARCDYLFKTHGNKPYSDVKHKHNPPRLSANTKKALSKVFGGAPTAKQIHGMLWAGYLIQRGKQLHLTSRGAKYLLGMQTYGDNPGDIEIAARMRERLAARIAEIKEHRQQKKAAHMPHLADQAQRTIDWKQQEVDHLRRSIRERARSKNPGYAPFSRTFKNGWKTATLSSTGPRSFVVIDQHQRRRSFRTFSGALGHVNRIVGGSLGLNPRGRRGGFKRLMGKLRHRKGVRSPRRLAAWIERRTYGKKRFQAMALAGRRRKARARKRRARGRRR